MLELCDHIILDTDSQKYLWCFLIKSFLHGFSSDKDTCFSSF